MKTRHFPGIDALVPPKIVWMQVNRVLAWALIVSPLAQWALGTAFMRGLALDLAMLLAHAAMSLVLFGAPKVPARRFSVAMHVFGRQPADLSPRNRFLLSGYRVGLTLLLLALVLTLIAVLRLIPFSNYLAYVGVLWIVAVPSSVLVLWPLLRMPMTLSQHLDPSIVQALRRWGMRTNAGSAAVWIVIFFFLFSYINLIR
ncbi:hypothetical protein IV454_04590 [Massilia antarctica]|uniref:Uncharacterized protein n=1 Tax=Massilia antarctica TaxID=2765360 RepID=A0AA48WFV9_9BURK|nr:hypothetical protein [Massilia antarctica]QPI50849.1 hypothetical protein IV454_04590 [Massilia antarctica]